jgi:hypothetical protein
MPRVRSIILDNSLGRVFSGVAKTTQAGNANVIGGAVQQSKAITSKSKTTSIINTYNIVASNAGLMIAANGGQVVSTRAITNKAHDGVNANLNIVIRVGLVYATSTVVATISLAPKTTSGTSDLAFTVPPGHYIYVDTLYVGTGTPTARAVGLTVTFNFYPSAT